jgi:hypothetical protein
MICGSPSGAPQQRLTFWYHSCFPPDQGKIVNPREIAASQGEDDSS